MSSRATTRTLMILGRRQRTIALLHVGRACHLAHTRRVPAQPGQAHPRVPVAYVLVPPGATAKARAAECARYLRVPFTTRMPQAQIIEQGVPTGSRGSSSR
ncbi:hypothetical protein [Streptomyces sp. SID3343]|uniref:hypothetical protein n=1 Tax=Streptomyces sp. SID3343 TaxID=2690260 RepID=UPI0031F9ECC9